TQVIAQAVSNCAVLLAVIGPTWLTATDEDGQRRLDDPDDIVRLEIQTALKRDIRVIPVLVEGAVMPRSRQLPEGLAGLARRNAHFLRHESFRYDAERLVTAIEQVLSAPPGVGTVPHPPPAEVVELSGDEQQTQIEREIAVCKRFDVPPDKGLNREEASRAFSDNGIDPRACGSWIQHGWIIREDDRRWLSDK